MRIIFLLTTFISLISQSTAWTQGEGRFWFLFSNSIVDFSGARPTLAPNPLSQTNVISSSYPGYYPSGDLGAQSAVSDPSGNLLFFVKYISTGVSGILAPLYPKYPKIFDRNGYSMPNSDIDAQWEVHSEQPLIVAHPGDSNQYFVFYPRNGGLKYSVVDMRLNNGLGAVLPGQKDVLLCPGQSINPSKMIAVQGCSAMWLVLRSAVANQYHSYRIDKMGIHTIPIVSVCGNLAIKDYNAISIFDGVNWGVGFLGGSLAASKDGSRLAACTRWGVELYDFERCSGKVLNPRLIDSVAVIGLCFSPNATRLYAAQIYPLPNYGFNGQVFQYDLDRKDAALITASKQLIISNQIMACWNPFKGCYCDTQTSRIGDLRLGPDNKIYMSNNKWYCHSGIPVFPFLTATPEHTLHVIHQPDALGAACNPELDYVPLRTTLAYTTLNNNSGRFMFLPQPMVSFSAIVDTILGKKGKIDACFSTSWKLSAPDSVSCLEWDDGSSEPGRVITTPGTYWLRYLKQCTFSVDTFEVHFRSLPEVLHSHYACPGQATIRVVATNDTSLEYTYTLYRDTVLVAVANGKPMSRFEHVDTGNYWLHIQSGDCDTNLPIVIRAYPVPDLHVNPVDTLIKYGDTIQLTASGANRYNWRPTKNMDNTHSDAPLVWPQSSTVFVVRGQNEYGCVDTGYIQVQVDYQMNDEVPTAFSPNGDGINDVFTISGLRYQKIELFQIFNRFGQQVFSSKANEKGWDGCYRGQPCDIGTYYYLIRLRYPDTKIRTIKGDVLLIR